MRRAVVLPRGGFAVLPALTAAVVVPRGNIAAMRAPAALTIDNFPADKVFQRAAGTTARTMRFSGTYTGAAPSSMQVRLINADTLAACTDYAALSSFVAEGGIWTGTLSCQSGGASGVPFYHAQPKDPATGTEGVRQTNKWAIGIRGLIFGESNNWRFWTQTATGLTANPYCRYYASYSSTAFGAGYGDGWYTTDKGNRGETTGGPIGMNALDLMMRALLVANDPDCTEVIGLVNLSVPGLTMQGLVAGQVPWTWMIGNDGIGHPAVGPEFEFALLQQGGNGVASGYAAALDTVHAQLLALTGRTTDTFKLGIMMLGSVDPGGPSVNDADANTERAAQYAKSQTAGCFFAGSALDFRLADFGHWVAAEYERAGKRYGIAWGEEFGYCEFGVLGPKILYAFWPVGSTELTIMLEHHSGGGGMLDGLGSTSGTSIDGFTVTSSGGQTVSGMRIAGTCIIATMSSARLAGQTVTVEFGNGSNPFGFPFDGNGVLDDVPFDNRAAYHDDDHGFPLLATFGTAITVRETSPISAHIVSAAAPERMFGVDR